MTDWRYGCPYGWLFSCWQHASAKGAPKAHLEDRRNYPLSPTTAICSLLSSMSFPLGNGKGRCPCDLTPLAGNHRLFKRRERAADRYKKAPLSDEPSLLLATSNRSGVGISSVQSMNTCLWASVQEAAEALGLSATRLRQLQAKGRLQPGVHWVYLTGTKGGPVGWSIDAIREWQKEQTKACVEAERAHTAAIEVFDEGSN